MVLIIAYGNRLRQDDGAGLILGQKLEQSWKEQNISVRRCESHQLVPELVLEIAQEEITKVVFIDTQIGPTSQIQIYPLELEMSSPPLGHHMTPTTLLIYARMLYHKEVAAWQITVPGFSFDHGETISKMTQQALSIAVDKLPHPNQIRLLKINL